MAIRFKGEPDTQANLPCNIAPTGPRSAIASFQKNLHFEDARPCLIGVCAPEQYILVRHGSNTWTRMQGGLNADDFLRTLPRWPKRFGDVMDASGQAFHESLK